MPIPITCEYCEESYRITDKAAGKRIRCKECGEAIDVPGRATPRSGAETSRARSRSRSSVAGSQGSRPPARGKSRSRPSEARSHISNRRKRQHDDGQAKNMIIGFCIMGISIVGGGAFLVYARNNPQPNFIAAASEFEEQEAAEKERLRQMRADSKRAANEHARRIPEESNRMIDGLNDASSDMGRPDMTPPEMISPDMTPPSSKPPGYRPPTGRPEYGGVPDTGRPPSFRPPSGRFGGPPGMGGQGPGRFGGSRSGSSGNLPAAGDSDEDLAALRKAMESNETSARSRAISALGRSSRKKEAAEILGNHLGGSDEQRIVAALGRLGAAAEESLLAGLQDIPLSEPRRVSPFLFALGRVGTAKSIPVLEQVAASNNRAAAALASSMLRQVKSRVGR